MSRASLQNCFTQDNSCSDTKLALPAGLDFRFRDPEAHFDRSRVKGVVARLVSIKDKASATALEVAAGGKLFQVVVDTEATAKALLAKGQLRSRVTIIPINKVCSRHQDSLVYLLGSR